MKSRWMQGADKLLIFRSTHVDEELFMGLKMNEFNSGFEQDRARTFQFYDIGELELARKKGSVAGTNNIE